MYFEDILWAYFVCYIDSHSLSGSFIIHIFSLKKWCKCDGMDVMAHPALPLFYQSLKGET